ncbi:MAG: hypothetical protein E6I81_14425 [Chloroflexi bacterium]|nr:MAG: hypothetical protein E6I81_14425 [Chloroflexota bacterium]TME01421.1 MAG: hypothetical protein E6I71_15600 [Chloroflexota bacterium]
MEAIEVEQRINAQPATVFAYLTDPARFVEWMGIGAELDPRPGGIFRLDVDGVHHAAGRFVAVEPPHRVVFTWGWEGSPEVAPGSTTVEITLVPDGEGTLLRLRHTDLPTEEQRASHRGGWVQYTRKLATLLPIHGEVA